MPVTVLASNTTATRERNSSGACFQDTLWLGDEGGQDYSVGMKFENVLEGMVQGITINRARLAFASVSKFGSNSSHKVYAEANSNPANMGTSTNNVSGRARTTSFASTVMGSYPASGPYCTVDFTDEIVELFENFNPAENGIVLVFITQSASTNNAVQFGSGATPDTSLEIDWTELAGGGPSRVQVRGRSGVSAIGGGSLLLPRGYDSIV